MYTVWTYAIYLVVSVALTVWVARTLFKNGRVFLVDALSGNEALADSLNHLLVVGFYLINVGYVTLALKYGDKPVDVVSAIELTSTKLGLVLLVLGTMHFFNLFVFAQARRRGLGQRGGTQPTPPAAQRPTPDLAGEKRGRGPHGETQPTSPPKQHPTPGLATQLVQRRSEGGPEAV